jgi:hypothetical protein
VLLLKESFPLKFPTLYALQDVLSRQHLQQKIQLHLLWILFNLLQQSMVSGSLDGSHVVGRKQQRAPKEKENFYLYTFTPLDIKM